MAEAGLGVTGILWGDLPRAQGGASGGHLPARVEAFKMLLTMSQVAGKGVRGDGDREGIGGDPQDGHEGGGWGMRVWQLAALPR